MYMTADQIRREAVRSKERIAYVAKRAGTPSANGRTIPMIDKSKKKGKASNESMHLTVNA